jgi:serine/threonine-protein kinase
MSPERLLGRPYDARADVYSVGVTLHEVLAGRTPFEASDAGLAALVLRLAYDEPAALAVHRPDLPPAALALARRAMARNPDDRPSAGELADELVALLDDDERAQLDRAEAPQPPTLDAPIAPLGAPGSRPA